MTVTTALMFREKSTVLENRKIAPGHYVLRLGSNRISKNAAPGRFVQILCADSYDPLLPRPFSFLTATRKDFSVLYQVVGRGTSVLSKCKKGDKLWVVGPLGNGFTTMSSSRRRGSSSDSRFRGNDTFILVGGGVGIPPLYHLAQTLVRQKIKPDSVHVFLGARDKSLLLCENDFKKLGVNLHLATDDGSKGFKGFVTENLSDFIQSSQHSVVRSQEKHYASLTTDYRLLSTKIYACGPTPMLKAVSMIAQKYKIPCEVSVEEPMACGFGACLGCAVRIRKQRTENKGVLTSEHRFAMACTEGPVFKAKDIIW